MPKQLLVQIVARHYVISKDGVFLSLDIDFSIYNRMTSGVVFLLLA